MNQKIYLITGTNRGLGKQLVKIIYKNHPDQFFLLASRAQPQLSQQQWAKQCPGIKCKCYQLDLASNQNIKLLSESLIKENIKIDYLINNAAFGADLGDKIPETQFAKKCFQTNTIGTIMLTQTLLPYLSNNCRIVNVSSKLGGLKYQGFQQQKFLNDENLTLERIHGYISIYLKMCEAKEMKGWFTSAYGTSKAMLNSWSRIILKKKLKQGQSVICMSPGSCQTDMGPPKPVSTAQEGAKYIYNCLFKPIKSDTFYHRDKQNDFFNCGQ